MKYSEYNSRESMMIHIVNFLKRHLLISLIMHANVFNDLGSVGDLLKFKDYF